jgi:coenzyme F420-0:L-glutamate ligase / coenzyme F420-1:gamma-L-glutamate ligase
MPPKCCRYCGRNLVEEWADTVNRRPTAMSEPPIATETVAAQLVALANVPLVKPGDDLASLTIKALARSGETLRAGDVLVFAQKIVSKAQGRIVRLDDVVPSARALQLATEADKDPRLVELILSESTEVVRHRRDVLVMAHRLGFVMANAGIDFSNVQQGADDDTALLLPVDPDGTCAVLRETLLQRTGVDVGIIINDSHGRAFRNGTVGVAIGACGLPAVADLRGNADLFGRPLRSSQVALADELASAASLLMGQAEEGRPIVLARGVPGARGEGNAATLVREKALDMFREPPSRDIGEVLRERRSIRRYLDRPIPHEVLENLLQAAIYAPSAHNTQPWRFAVLAEQAGKERLARSMGDRLRADRTRDGDRPEAITQDVARSFARITAAPVVVVICLTIEDLDSYPDARRSTAEHQMAVQGVGMAMQNMQIAATAAGLGAAVMCAPLFCPDTVRAACDLPAAWEPQALITIGYPANAGKPFRRRPMAEIVRYLDGAS